MTTSSFRHLDPRIFDRNWDALSFHHPHLADRICRTLGIEDGKGAPELSHIPPLDDIDDVLVAGKGTVTATRDDGTRAEIIGPQWTRTSRQASRKAIVKNPSRILFVFSCGDFSLLDDCDSLIGFDQRAIVMIEQEAILFLAALAMRDRTDILSHPNLFFCVGNDYDLQLQELCRENAFEVLPPSQMTAVAGAGFAFPDDRERYLGSIRTFLAKLAEAHNDFNAKLQVFFHDLSHPRQLHTPPRIWGYAVAPEKMLYSIHREILQALFDGFQAAEWDAWLLLETRERWTTRNRILRDITVFDPDVYFFLNSVSDQFFKSLFGAGLPEDAIRRPRIVCLSDEFVFSPIGSAEGLGQWDHVFAMDPEYLNRLSDRNIASLHYLPVAASVTEPGTCREEFHHPISFVGSIVDLSDTLNSLPVPERDWLEEKIERVLQGESLFDVIPDNDAAIPPRLTSICWKYCSSVRKPFLQGSRAIMYLLSVEANTRKRVRTLAELIPYNVAIYGPKEWMNLLPPEGSDNCRGPLPYEQIPNLFASSSINLNIHSLQCPSALNSRDFDILASGGFLLSDYVTEADGGLITHGRDAVFYHGIEDLKNQVEFYLSNENERKEIARHGHQTAINNHSFRSRAQQMLDAIL